MRLATINGVFFQCLKDRSSRPYRQPKRTDAALEQLILDLRARTNLGPVCGLTPHWCLLPGDMIALLEVSTEAG